MFHQSPGSSQGTRRAANRAWLQLCTLENRLTPTAFSVQNVTFGDGTANRSDVSQVKIKFTTNVAFASGNHGTGAASDPVTLYRHGNDESIPTDYVTMSVTQTAGDELTLTAFTGTVAETNGSLKNGYYDLYIDHNHLSGTGNTINGQFDTAGSGADYYAIGNSGPQASKNNFFRLAGDGDGDAFVGSQTDFVPFRNAFSVGPNASWDFDNNGNVDQLDYIHFRNIYGWTFP